MSHLGITADLRIERTQKRYDYPPGEIFPVEGGVGTPAQGIAAGDSESHDLREGFDLLFDKSLAWGQFKVEHGLRSAILLSLFTDRLADDSDVVPHDHDRPAFPERHGYWADFLSPLGPDDRYGSRLWLLVGKPLTGDTRAKARAYALESLEWLQATGIGEAEVTTSIPRRGWLALTVTITDTTTRLERRYSFLWDSMTSEGA